MPLTVLGVVLDGTGISQSEIAKALGLRSRETISRWANGRAAIPAKHGRKLERAFKIPAEILGLPALPLVRQAASEREVVARDAARQIVKAIALGAGAHPRILDVKSNPGGPELR